MSVWDLREYQTECLDSIQRALAGQKRGTGVGICTRAAVVLPTGMGKTVIFAELARSWPLGRVLILVHRDELAEQAYRKVHSADPSLRVGIVKAERNDVDADVIVGSVQTLRHPRRLAQLRDIGLVIVDECHHANAASYVTVMTELGCYNDAGTPCVGFTATLVRADKLKPGDVWQEVVYTKDIVWGIRNGYLVDVKGKRIQVKNLDLSRVRRLAGDLQADAVAAELLDAEAPEQIAAAYSEHASDRLGVVFWPNVLAAEAGFQAFEDADIKSAVILGTTPKDERETAYAAHAAGDIQVLHNVNVLTEGWDQPAVSCVVPARLTQSAGLYMQMIGRGTRPSPGKRDLLVLDPVGVTGRHKLATLADTSMSLHGVEEDETLTEAADRAEREELLAEALALGVDPSAIQDDLLRLEVEQARREQERVAKEVSLFAERAAVWLQTPHGVWFIPVKDWFLFLWPEGHGLFQVGTCRISSPAEPPFMNARVLASGLLQDGAMAYAEKLAKQADPAGHTERTAAWRRNSRPTAGRARFARSLGIKVTQLMTDADVADAIHGKLAARSLGG